MGGRGLSYGQVVSEQLHDERAVLVAVLVERVELGDGVVEGLLGQIAGALGRVEDLVVENGEVERQAETDRMCGRHLSLGDLERLRVGLLRVVNNACSIQSSHKSSDNNKKSYIIKKPYHHFTCMCQRIISI